MVGPEIQATERTSFEDDQSVGNQSDLRNNLQRVCTITEINVTIDTSGEGDLLARSLRGQTNIQPASPSSD